MQQRHFVRGIGWFVSAIALFAIAMPVAAQTTGTLSVTVRDRTNGEPINGARVVVEGTQLTGVTDGRGVFTLPNAPTGTFSIRVLSIGYRSGTQQVTIAAGGRADLTFQLGLSAISLDEIVVTGTGGAVEKRKLGATLGTVDVNQVTAIVPANDFGTILQARIPGVRSIGMSGGVGSSKDLRIRGMSSFSLGQRPVIYIDGVRVDNRPQPPAGANSGSACCSFDGGAGNDRLSDLNPDDIDRIEVIKGAAAATLYGTEASNGVIQIFTKKGRNNSAARWTITYQAGFNRLRDNLGTDLAPNFTGPSGFQARSASDLIENGLIQHGDVTVQGGGDAVTYFAAGAFHFEEGSIQPNDQTRGNARLNLNWNSSERWNFEFTSGFSSNKVNLLQSGNNWTAQLGNARLGNPQTASADRPYGEPWVAVSDIKEMKTSSTVNRFTGGLTANYRPTDFFGHRLTVGVDQVNDRRERFFPFGRQFVFVGNDGERNLGFRDFSSYTLDYLGTLGFDISGGIQSDFSFGAQGFWELERVNLAIGEGFAGTGVTTVNGGATTTATEVFREEINVGLFAQNRFSVNDRLFVTVGARFDGNSAFGDNFGLQFYPKAELAYLIPETALPGFITSLKVRSAVGMSGLAPGAFDQFRTFTPFTALEDESAVRPNNPGNADLEPEKTTEIEGGLDIGLFADRLSIEATGFYNRTRDAILAVPLPPSRGFNSSRRENVGELENIGWELSVNAAVVEAQSVRWTAGLNMNGGRNEILDLGPGAECNAEGTECRLGQFRTGRSVGAQFNRVITGYDAATNTHSRSDTTEFIGDPLPTWEGSLFNSFELGAFRVYGLVSWETGAFFNNGDRSFAVRQGARDEFLSLLNPDGSATFASDSLLNMFTLVSPTDKRDNIRLREVSVSYQIPLSLTQRFGLGRSSLSVAGQNLHWWDDCNCSDPNGAWRGGSDNPAAFGTSGFLADPQPRRFVFSIKTSF